MVLTLLLCLSFAGAHPAGATNASNPRGGMPGQRIEATVAPGHVRVDYFVELAAIRMLQDARAAGAEGPAWAAKRVEELRPGVRVRWNGSDLALTTIVVPEPAKLQGVGEVELHLAAEATLPPSPGTLELRMDNFPDEASFFAASVTVDGALVVRETSLGRVVGGRLRDNQHGAWRRDDRARITSLSLRPTRLWESGVTGPLPARLEDLLPPIVSGWVLAGGIGISAWGILGYLAWMRRVRSARANSET